MLAALALITALGHGPNTFREVNGLQLEIDHSCDVGGCGAAAFAPIVTVGSASYRIEHVKGHTAVPWSDPSLALEIELRGCIVRTGLSVRTGRSTTPVEVIAVGEGGGPPPDSANNTRVVALLTAADYQQDASIPIRVEGLGANCSMLGEIPEQHVAALKAWAHLQYEEQLALNKEHGL